MLTVSCTRALVQKSYGFPKQKRKGINFLFFNPNLTTAYNQPGWLVTWPICTRDGLVEVYQKLQNQPPWLVS